MTDMSDKERLYVLPPWEDIPNISQRSNDLMRQNWVLVAEATRICNSIWFDGVDCTPETEETLKDIWAESIDIERKFKQSREDDFTALMVKLYGR